MFHECRRSARCLGCAGNRRKLVESMTNTVHAGRTYTLQRIALERAVAPAVHEERTQKAAMRVGPADDRYERQADEVARDVVRRLTGDARDTDLTTTRGATLQRSATGEVGAAGGAVDADVQQRIESARSNGQPLEAPMRGSMEAAFGDVDFGGVRIHRGTESADLNQRVGASAFTVGNDIFLGGGAESLSSRGGQQLLAHELTHTLQQSGTAQRSVIRRLSVDKPIKKVTSINVVIWGASGKVAEVSDGGKKVMVKVDQGNAAEVIAADRLARKSGAASGKYKVKAPKSRIATAAELQELQAKAADPNVMKAPDPRNWVTALTNGTNPSIVAEAMEGEQMKEVLEKASGKSTKYDKVAKKNVSTYVAPDPTLVAAVRKLITSSAAIKTMAKGMTSDVAMGMADRVLGSWNSENFLFNASTKRFAFVDNTMNIGSGMLVASAAQSAYDSFEEWGRLGMVVNLANNMDAMAQTFVKNYTGLEADGTFFNGGIIYPFRGQGPKYDASETKTVHDNLWNLIAANRDAMVAAAKDGLTSGKAVLLKNLAAAAKLTRGLPAAQRLEATTSLLARRLVLLGAAPKAAWAQAAVEARVLLKLPPLPALPQAPVRPGARPGLQGGGHRVPQPV